MVFVACGLNHKTAPLALREKIALSEALQENLLASLVESPMAEEAAMLSTCNRTEFYCETDNPGHIVPWLADQYHFKAAELQPHFYLHPGEEGIRHTLRVASGLDSMMLGEPQILGQMKQAYQFARQIGTAKSQLGSVFDYVFSASKRIRTRSGIGNNPISIAYAAVQLIKQQFADPSQLSVFLIGSGETAGLVSKYLLEQGVKKFLVASRTLDNAKQLAATFAGQALNIGDIPQYLAEADIVISATACPLPFINQNLVQHALANRNHAPMFFLDLAVPRDIEENVAELEGVTLYNIDDLQNLTQKGWSERQNAALEAEQLISLELENYIRWHRSLRARELICRYRQQMQDLAEAELNKSLRQLAKGEQAETILNELTQRLVNKIMHSPSRGLRQIAWDDRSDLLELASFLFNPAHLRQEHEEIA